MGGYAWVTLATNDAYSLGALVLAHSLRRVGTKYELAVLITPGVTQIMREKLLGIFSVVMEVNVLDSKDEANLALLARPELGITFTKLHCWRLIQYEKCVFLDADTLVVRNCDELFEREELSAAPDVGWPDCFNSGVFVYRPSQQTFASITAFAAAKGSFDGGDQGLLNMYFSDWARKDISKHLPFIYNMCSTATYSYLPAFKQFGDDVRIIHFIGITKPWLQYFDTLTGVVQPPMGSIHLQPLLQLWWNIFCEKVHSQLSPVMATSTLAPIWHEFSPMFFESYVPKNPICTDIQDKMQNDIYLEPPDFSEFQDPWENYYVQNNSIIYKAENNERQQYYSVNSNSSPVSVLNEQFSYLKSVQQIHESSSKYNRELQHNQQYNEHIFSLHTQYHQNHQEQSNQFINKIEKRHSFSNSDDTTILNIPNYFQLEHNVKKCIPIHNHIQNHHSSECQDKSVNYQYNSQNSCNNNNSNNNNSNNNNNNNNNKNNNNNNNNNNILPKEIKQQHINYEQTYQHSSNNNNKSLSEEVKYSHKLHNNHHDDHYYQMLDNINNKQCFQHHEQKNQTCDSLDVNIIHDQHYIMLNNITYQNNVLIKENIEQNENMNVTDKQTCTLISTSPHPDSKPCIDFHNVATQSDPHIMDDLNNSNAGLAGALAQMTLGEPRSSEQIALEEHMRKQSWEQGQIDYMGRDSFDNIWKKICETLALAPPRLPSPPKEIRKSVKNKIDETDEFIKSAETTQFIKSTDEVDKRTAQTSSHIEEQSLVNNVPITNVPKLLEDQKNEDDISRESQNDIFIDSPATNFSLQTSHEEITKHNTTELLNKISQQTSVPIVSSDLNQSSIGEQKIIISTKELENKLQQNKDLKIIIDIHQMNQLDIRDEKYAKELLTASQILPVSPVPIQVAESVLQMELKESMLDSQIISQEVVSSTIKPIHLTETENKIHINDSRFSIENKEKLNLDNTTNVKNIEGINKLSKLSIKPKETSQISLTVEQIQPQFVEIESTLSSNNFEIPEKLMQKQTEQQTKNEYCIKETMKLNEIGSEYETNKILNTPVRPLRIKELNSSPSTSIKEIRQFDSISQKKLIKKIVKKSTEKSVSVGELVEANDDDIEKKVIKKIVKKKKLKSEGLDDNIDSNSFNKQKKTLKIVKKGIKSSQRTSTDTIVPEIPTSSTSDLTPIPPKRKVKTAKSVIKKSDIE